MTLHKIINLAKRLKEEMGDHVQYHHHDVKVKTKIMCFKLQNYQHMASKLREEMGDLQQRRPWPEPPERGRGDVALCQDLWTESSFGESQIASLVGSLGASTKRKVQNSKKIGFLSASLAMFLLSPPYIVHFLFSTMGNCKWSFPSSPARFINSILLSQALFSHHSAPFHQFWFW